VKNPLFHSATLRLTAWYMAILMVLSLLFSLIVYNIASHEFQRAVGPRRPGEMQLYVDSDIVNDLRQQRIEDSSHRLIADLLAFNFFTLALGGAASYLLARRTLRPIEDALEAQSRFSSDAAHELRTPLAIMQSEIEVELRDKKASKQTHEQTLASNLEEVERLRTLTDRLLLLAGNQELPLGTVSIEDAAIEAVNRMIPLAQAKNISIDNAVVPVNARANYDSLVDTLTVIIDNAIKYSPEGSQVSLKSATFDKIVELRVTDEGPGLSEQEQAKIFDRFYRADSARSAQHVEGHGLGLSIARRLMSLQHGSVSVQSQPGKGATFILRIPFEHSA
jgi:signal transduction histidine kinase